MDRLDAMAAFIATAEEGRLAGAARRLGYSPATVTRLIAGLERNLKTRLLHRTTRVVRLTEAGERYLATCRRVLAELQQADLAAASDQAAPQGLLSVTAPALFGRLHVRPFADAFLDDYPAVRLHLLLLDRVVDMIEEGIDVAVRIGHLPDSSLVAIKVGQLRRIVCASPAYITKHKPIRAPADLKEQVAIGFSQARETVTWSFGGSKPTRMQHVKLQPRLMVNSAEAAVASAIEGRGVVQMLSYQVADALKAGQLVALLTNCEPPPPPVHIVYPERRPSAAKTRAFVEFIVPRLRARLAV